MKRITKIASITLGVAAFAILPATAKDDCASFSELRMVLEQNATDGDTEVVLFAKGQDDGLKSLAIFAPNYRLVAFFAGDQRGIGIREFQLESAEPPDLAKVLASFPQGSYNFVGRSVKGECLRGNASLSHTLAPASTLLTPLEEQVVPTGQVVLSWAGVSGAARYIIELNNESAGTNMTFEVLPPTTSLAVPAQFLQANAEYQFVVGVKTASGNATSVERTFFTAP
jgi:hypothetical protein